MIVRRPLAGVLGQLANEGLLTEPELEAARGAAAHLQPASSPWFVRVLVGVGAWVSAGLLVLFLALAKLLDGPVPLVGFGVCIYAAGAFLRRASHGDFAVQASLAAGLGGAAMLLFGVADGPARHEVAVSIVLTIVLSAITLVAYPDVVLRFVATVVGCGAFLAAFHELELGPDGALAAIGVAGGVVWHRLPRLLANRWTRPLALPVGWGLVLSLLFFTALTATDATKEFRVGPVAGVAMGLALGAVVVAIAVEHGGARVTEPLVVALVGVVALCGLMLHAPGVPAGLYVAALAFHRRMPLLLAFGLVFLVGFLTFFYFELPLPLLQRSGVLLASGAVLFVVRAYARYRFGPITVEEL